MKGNVKGKMDDDCIGGPGERWARVGNLIVDLCSLEKGFREMEKYRQEIWEYVKYRESLILWPSPKCGIDLSFST